MSVYYTDILAAEVKRSCNFPFSIISLFLWLSKKLCINLCRARDFLFWHINNRCVSHERAFFQVKDHVIFPFLIS